MDVAQCLSNKTTSRRWKRIDPLDVPAAKFVRFDCTIFIFTVFAHNLKLDDCRQLFRVWNWTGTIIMYIRNTIIMVYTMCYYFGKCAA